MLHALFYDSFVHSFKFTNFLIIELLDKIQTLWTMDDNDTFMNKRIVEGSWVEAVCNHVIYLSFVNINKISTGYCATTFLNQIF